MHKLVDTQGQFMRGLSGRSAFRGVSWVELTRQWRVDVYYQKKQVIVGRYDDELEAARAYDTAAQAIKGSQAVLNFGPPKITVPDESEKCLLLIQQEMHDRMKDQTEMANELAVSQPLISRWLSGTKRISLAGQRKILDILPTKGVSDRAQHEESLLKANQSQQVGTDSDDEENCRQMAQAGGLRKRGGTAYSLFCAGLRKKIKHGSPELGFGEISKELGTRWKALSKSQQKAYKDSAAAQRGLTWCKKKEKWTVRAKVNGENRYVGYFDDEEQAAMAYKKHAEEKCRHAPRCARLVGATVSVKFSDGQHYPGVITSCKSLSKGIFEVTVFLCKAVK
jgi:hypothetical protein